MAAVRPDPKPRRRTVNPRAGRAKIAGEGRCRACGEPNGTFDRKLDRHHLVPRSLGGDDVDENLIPLCSRCHGEYERGRLRLWVGARIRVSLRPDEADYVMRRKGPAFMDRYYPVPCE